MNYLDYWDKMIRQNCGTGEQIARVRWEFVKEVGARTVLDYGCGPGFFKAFRPEGVEVDTYDLNPYPQTGIRRDRYEMITLWDVLEHFEDLDRLGDLVSMTDHIALTTPILPQDPGFDMESWKHYKPGEHFQYFTDETLKALFNTYGFELLKRGTPETPPRSDVASFIFRRRGLGERSV